MSTLAHPSLLARPLALLLGVGALLCGSVVARAGAPEAAPAQVGMPWTFGPEVEGVEGVTGHAAGLGFMQGSQLGLGMSLRLDGAGLGDGLFVGGAARLGPLGLGLGVSRVGADGLGDGTTRLDLAQAFRFARWGAIGLRWHGLFGDAGQGLDGFGSIALSTTLRPARFLSVALAVDRINRPALGGSDLPAVLRAQVGLRPNSERVTFGLEAAAVLDEDSGWLTGVSLRLMPIEGLELGGYGRFVSDPGEPDRMEWGAFLALRQGGASVEAGLDRRTRVSDQAIEERTDLSVLLKHSSVRGPSLITPGHRAVRLAIGGGLPERPGGGLGGPGTPPFGIWLVALDAMARDADVDVLLLEVGAAPGWAQSWELRRAIQRLRDAGKTVIVSLTRADMRTMYLASAADHIWLDPVGMVSVVGLSTTRTYLAGLLALFGVNAQFIKWDDYKSAPERFTREGPSEPAKEQADALLDAFDAAWFRAVGEGRGLDRQRLDAIIADGPQTMIMAHQLGLVDRIVAETDREDALAELMGHRVRITDGYAPPPSAWPRWGSSKQIAVIPVVGSIVDGQGSDLAVPFFGISTGDRDVVGDIDRALADSRVAALVIRVDSPGGAVLASDRMHLAIQRAARKKPVVISFGDIAASGGYYLACGGQPILSAPVTITGSIGIYTGKISLAELYDRIGLTTWTQRTAPQADQAGTHRPWTEAEMARGRERLKAYYDRFVGLVAKGRGLSEEVAHDRARGRVYSGDRALALGLVDGEGGLWEAVARARKEARLGPGEPWTLSYPDRGGLLQQLQRSLRLPLGAARAYDLPAPASTPVAAPLVDALRTWMATLDALSRGGVQARMPYTLDIR